MKVNINGTLRTVPEATTVQILLDIFQLGGERVAVECNGNIVSRTAFADCVLHEGDQVEVVRFVGGG